MAVVVPEDTDTPPPPPPRTRPQRARRRNGTRLAAADDDDDRGRGDEGRGGGGTRWPGGNSVNSPSSGRSGCGGGRDDDGWGDGETAEAARTAVRNSDNRTWLPGEEGGDADRGGKAAGAAIIRREREDAASSADPHVVVADVAAVAA